ncbi:prepilin peptidase [uncultured Jatrophihabitans sp.]|uniref:prepilin peptidase n=1 Tax=uncultured Jatrophihabitans sp. TaxID=1610747 RepID=UPI0035CB7069
MSAAATGAHVPVAALLGAIGCAAASPYLARLTTSVPDRTLAQWWTGLPVTRSRVVVTAVVGTMLGALAGAAAGLGALLPAFVALALVCAPLVVIDYEVHRLPNRLVYVAVAGESVLLTVAAVAQNDWHRWLRGLEAAAAVLAVLFLLALASPRSFGLGDVRLGGVLGGYLGWFGWGYVYYGIFAGFLLGAVVSLALIATRRAGLKTAIAFGPMLIFGALLVLAFDLVPAFAG